MLLAWWAGCGGDGTEAPSPTGDTGAAGSHTGPALPPPGVTCVAQPDNVLRFTCGVRLDDPAAVTLTWRRTDGLGAARTVTDPQVATLHELDVAFLAAQRDYGWTLAAADDPETVLDAGTFSTGPLPREASARLTSSGVSTAPYLGMATPCSGSGTALIVETATGEVVWYQTLADGPDVLEGLDFTEERTVLATDGDSLQEVDLAGRRVLRLGPQELGVHVHHAVFRRAGLTYIVFQDPWVGPNGAFLLDGFLVFRDEERVATWHLSDHYTPSGLSPGLPLDWSHANSVWADPQGTVYLSLRSLSTVLAIDGRWDGPEGGEVRWALSPPGSEIPSDYAIATAVDGPADFDRQHDPWVDDAGRLTLFDNRPLGEPSRMIDLALDPGVATITEAYPAPPDAPAGGHCDFQGAARRTPAGRPIATCAPSRVAWEFDPGDGSVSWTGEVGCLDGAETFVPRMVPLDW